MADAHVITILGTSRLPGADLDEWRRFLNWGREVYRPVIMTTPERLAGDMYHIIRQSPDYPESIVMYHLENLLALERARKNPDYGAVSQDWLTWRSRNVLENIWSATYQLEKGNRIPHTLPYQDQDTRIDNAPIMHFEAYRLTPEDAEKYRKWFNDYAFNIFIPLFMKMSGLIGYDFVKDTGLRIDVNSRESDYPAYFSIVYFENFQAYENYEKSPELDNLRKNLRSVFPNGLNYKWHVQYELEKSWRK